MKAAFFYSHKQANLPNRSRSTSTIDGLPYSQVITLEDDAPINHPNSWDDCALVKVVENVDVITLPLIPEFKTVSLWTGVLTGRVEIK